jgi:hypothetical protein
VHHGAEANGTNSVQCRRSIQNQPVMVELKPATFFRLNPAEMFWQGMI